MKVVFMKSSEALVLPSDLSFQILTNLLNKSIKVCTKQEVTDDGALPPKTACACDNIHFLKCFC